MAPSTGRKTSRPREHSRGVICRATESSGAAQTVWGNASIFSPKMVKSGKLRSGTGSKLKRWKKGHSSDSNPQTSRFRQAAKSRFFSRPTGELPTTRGSVASANVSERQPFNLLTTQANCKCCAIKCCQQKVSLFFRLLPLVIWNNRSVRLTLDLKRQQLLCVCGCVSRRDTFWAVSSDQNICSFLLMPGRSHPEIILTVTVQTVYNCQGRDTHLLMLALYSSTLVFMLSLKLKFRFSATLLRCLQPYIAVYILYKTPSSTFKLCISTQACRYSMSLSASWSI